MGGQLRMAPSGAIVGWDLGAALALSSALGIDRLLAAEVLPVIEAVAVRCLNQSILSAMDRDDG